jgi:O-antigen/teichoic acid export membrane protein
MIASTLLQRTLRSTAWGFAGQLVAAVLSFGLAIVSARLLTPSELGLYAVVMIVVSLAVSASSFHSWGYYVVTDEATDDLLRTGLTVELALGAVLWLAVSLVGALWAAISGDTEIAWLLIAAGIVLVLNPFVVLSGVFRRTLEYRLPTLALIGSAVVAVGTKIALLVMGLGPWALVVGDIVQSGTFAAAMLALVPAGRSLEIDRDCLRRLTTWGLPTLATTFSNQLWPRVQEAVVAVVLGAQRLGYFFLASRLPSQVQILGQSLALALLPAFARSDERQLARSYGSVTRMSAFLMIPPVVVSVALPRELITIFFGSTWLPAAVPMAFLMAATAIRFVFWHAYNLLKSRNRVREMAYVTAVQTVVGAVAVTAGAVLGGLAGVAAAVLVVELIVAIPKVLLIKTVVPFPVIELLRVPVLMCALGLLAAALAGSLLPDALALAVGAGVSVLLALLGVWRTESAVLAAVRTTAGRVSTSAS